jgi:hypothetical protein
MSTGGHDDNDDRLMIAPSAQMMLLYTLKSSETDDFT